MVVPREPSKAPYGWLCWSRDWAFNVVNDEEFIGPEGAVAAMVAEAGCRCVPA